MARQPRVPGAEAQPPKSSEPEQTGGRPMTLNEIAAAEERVDPGKFDGAPEQGDDEAYREHAKGLRAKDVDATRLKRAVLTLDGWVCPATVPTPKGKE